MHGGIKSAVADWRDFVAYKLGQLSVQSPSMAEVTADDLFRAEELSIEIASQTVQDARDILMAIRDYRIRRIKSGS